MSAENKATDDFMVLGQKLSEALRTQSDGADSDGCGFADEIKKQKLSPRKAYYLVEVYEAFHEFPVPRARLLNVGWTKLQMMCGYVTPENYLQLLAEAEKHPVHRFREILEGNWPEEAKHCVLIYLFPEEYEIFCKVLKAHGAKPRPRGLHGKEEALINALRMLLPEEQID